jgi:ABC-type nickel/cobalt efflux system permease component RcnA
MWKWKATAMALGVALTIAVFMLHAKSSSLTALDYIQIQQLANRYGQTAPGSSEK